jgi:hypothetical protein
MAFYVDFDIETNPGWEIDNLNYPMGWTEFINGSPGVYYCKGNRDSVSEVVYLADKEIRPWSLINFGPWRMNVDVITGTPSQSSNNWKLKGGIIKANDIIIQGAAAIRNYHISNVYINLTNDFTVSSYLSQPVNMYFKGCTLICDNLKTDVNTPETVLNGLYFRDSIVVTNTNVNEGAEFRNSVFSASTDSWSNAIQIDCEFLWTQPVWPTWDAVKEEWAFSLLNSAIIIKATGDFVDYEEGLFGVSRSIIAGIGAFYFDVSNHRIYISQRVNRHVIKRLDSNSSPAIYDGRRYGIFSEIGRLRFPSSITTDGSLIYLADYGNKRVIGLSFGLDLVTEVSTSSTVNMPRLIYYDPLTNDIYTLGITPNFWNMKICRLHYSSIDNTLMTVKTSDDFLGKMDDGKMPMGLTRGFTGTAFIVCGLGNDLFITYESASGFTTFEHQSIEGIKPTRYLGMIRHNNGDLYLNDGHKIVRANFNYQNIGDSDFISKSIYGLKEARDGSILTYNADKKSLVRYDYDLNFVENIYTDSGLFDIEFDAIDLFDFIEVDLMSSEVPIPSWPRENAYGEAGYGEGPYGS